ncbi:MULTISPECIES: hypothetical protein [Acetobacter]|uniref:Uncharacterized protein n=1 Tax=Acetobacter pomorum DM001 TaxID=945681 RepID=F1YUP7_9PROT|nr:MULTISPECIES: hypothetical protein [Acetobacter]EGE47454.1 Hypothetical protein APO_1671 [Acetobacter pomorum DM001]KAA8424213.1 hypothetical protein FKW54_10200 [Acetobacter pomorum]KAA8431677.1 hypothetical protein FKW50_12490 [Acetobacter pomorum]KAA8449880.1 hypothetical protein FKW52_11240 [Acetobacter pomorum]KGB24242.1 hypothetical protein ApDm4_1518 [Acetobacter pomorum]
MVSRDILDKCTTQEKIEVLECWRDTSEAVNRERVRSQVIKLPVIFRNLETLLGVIQDSPEDLAELKNHAYALKACCQQSCSQKVTTTEKSENCDIPRRETHILIT